MRELHMSNMMRRYCHTLTPDVKSRMEEKVVTESLFKGKKSSYSERVKEPFSHYTQGEEPRAIIWYYNGISKRKWVKLYRIELDVYPHELLHIPVFGCATIILRFNFIASHIPGLQGITGLNQLHTQVFSKLNKRFDPPEQIVVSYIQQVIFAVNSLYPICFITPN